MHYFLFSVKKIQFSLIILPCLVSSVNATTPTSSSLDLHDPDAVAAVDEPACKNLKRGEPCFLLASGSCQPRITLARISITVSSETVRAPSNATVIV
jgi:hypothetical protein